ncbi:MAG: multiheme c-type cytochrome [bacterium]
MRNRKHNRKGQRDGNAKLQARRPEPLKPEVSPEQAVASRSGSHGSARPWLMIGLATVAAASAILLAIIVSGLGPFAPPRPLAETPLAYVGSDGCAACHPREAQAWGGSHHRHAMAHAAESTVRGDFADARFDYHGVQSRFFRRDGKFMVETDGPDGSLQTYEVKYTFGLEPLQQYLIAFPDGRVQALSIAWDARPKEHGGQRWFHLYPDEKIDNRDELHWTRLNQNWNFMCAECHSTGVRKNYDAKTNSFRTSFAEISVGCETCHGQGSRHVTWAKNRQGWWPSSVPEDPSMGLLVRYLERLNATWPLNPETGSAKRSVPPATLRTEVETCGLCHARRAQLSEDWRPGRSLSETHQVSPLHRGLFHADGQMLDEVFNYASFKQSKMFAAGVTCGDCHDPHSAKPRLAGDNLCLQCHSSEKFATPTHHRHAAATPAPSCVSCHMPVRTYMVIDNRHDHSFRVPRPDLSVTTGTPNACNDCHKEKTAQWAAHAVESWHGPARKGLQAYAPAFKAAWDGKANAARLLAAVAGGPSTPGIARATALGELAAHLSNELVPLARAALADPDPMVRLGALDMLDRGPPDRVWPLASPLLRDPVLSVRIRAAQLLASVPTAQQPANDRRFFDAAAREYIAAQRLNADRPEARSSLGSFFARRGQAAEAEEEFKAALRLNAQFAPAAINLADLYAQTGRDGDGEEALLSALAASPGDAGLHHARGLALVRLRRLDDAVAALGRASEIDPAQARYGYVHAVALHAVGRLAEAVEALKVNTARHPSDRESLLALATYAEEARDLPLAIKAVEQLAVLTPGNMDIEALLARLRREAAP